MIWWGIFIGLVLARNVATVRYVPAVYLLNYKQCRKGLISWAALLAQESIWIVAAIQSLIAPDRSVPVPLRALGALLFILASLLLIWARRVNPYAIPEIARPAKIIRAGPYAVFKHPMYIGLGFGAFGVFLLLGQPWALVPIGVYLNLLFYRAIVETRFLSRQFSL